MPNYPQEISQDAVCQSNAGHMTGLWFLPTRPLRLNTNEWWMNEAPLEQNMFNFMLCVLHYTSVHAYILGDKSLIKLRFVVSHQDAVLQETEKDWPTFNGPTIKHVVFLRKHKESNLCWHNILTGVFVTKLSSNAGTSAEGTVWVTKACFL